MTLDGLLTMLAAVAVLLLGAGLNRLVGVLARYNIPDPITGGIAFALLAAALTSATGLTLGFDATLKPYLLLMFFAAVGLTADMRSLAKGGRTLVLFLIVLVPFIFVQNLTGTIGAWPLDLHPLFGLIVGSITLVGGHGTGAAYADRFAEVNNIQGIMPLTMTSATVGLVIGGVVGGPVAQLLIRRHGLAGNSAAAATEEPGSAEASAPAIDAPAFVLSLGAVLLAVAVGRTLAVVLDDAPITLPSFVWCLLAGVVLRNGVAPLVRAPLSDRASDLIGSICLSLFLALTMMALDLLQVVQLAGPLVAILLLQIVVAVIYVGLVVFPVMGRDYEAAVMSAAFIGFMMGATATAIANMQALTRRYGPAPLAFLVVPLSGAFFIDIANAIALTAFLLLPMMGG
jgi:ESS family glutamate:Na+ symporter